MSIACWAAWFGIAIGLARISYDLAASLLELSF